MMGSSAESYFYFFWPRSPCAVSNIGPPNGRLLREQVEGSVEHNQPWRSENVYTKTLILAQF
jgi:hypothetical protein